MSKPSIFRINDLLNPKQTEKLIKEEQFDSKMPFCLPTSHNDYYSSVKKSELLHNIFLNSLSGLEHGSTCNCFTCLITFRYSLAHKSKFLAFILLFLKI
jgi:hypothetical protein